MVTPDIVFDVLYVPRVAHPDYPSCDRLKMSLYPLFVSVLLIGVIVIQPLLKVLGLLTWL